MVVVEVVEVVGVVVVVMVTMTLTMIRMYFAVVMAKIWDQVGERNRERVTGAVIRGGEVEKAQTGGRPARVNRKDSSRVRVVRLSPIR